MSIGTKLSKFQNVNSGDDVRSVAKSGRVNSLQDLTKSLVGGEQVTQSGSSRRVVGPGYSIVKTKNANFVRGRKGKFPWMISVTNFSIDPESPDYRITLRPGTINTIVPSNMFSNFAIPLTGTYYTSLDCTTDGTSVTAAVINVSTTPPAPLDEDMGAAPDFFQLLLGMTVDLKIYQFIDYVLFAFPIRTIYSIKDSPEPGQPYYDLHYSWQLNSHP